MQQAFGTRPDVTMALSTLQSAHHEIQFIYRRPFINTYTGLTHNALQVQFLFKWQCNNNNVMTILNYCTVFGKNNS